MERPERITRASDLYDQLAGLEQQLSELWRESNDTRPRKDLMIIRAQMISVEHQIAVLRLIQGENRLRQQRWIALHSFFRGSFIILVTQKLLSWVFNNRLRPSGIFCCHRLLHEG